MVLGSLYSFDDVGVWQLREFKERNALVKLREIANYDPDAKANIGWRNRKKTIMHAQHV